MKNKKTILWFIKRVSGYGINVYYIDCFKYVLKTYRESGFSIVNRLNGATISFVKGRSHLKYISSRYGIFDLFGFYIHWCF